jgi:hypothetical protein
MTRPRHPRNLDHVYVQLYCALLAAGTDDTIERLAMHADDALAEVIARFPDDDAPPVPGADPT